MSQKSHQVWICSDSGVTPLQQRLVQEGGAPLLCAIPTSSLLLPSSSHSGVDGVCHNSTVVVAVPGHLYVAVHAPTCAPAGRRAYWPLGRKNTAQKLRDVNSQETETEAALNRQDGRRQRVTTWLHMTVNHSSNRTGHLSTHIQLRTRNALVQIPSQQSPNHDVLSL